MEKPMSKFELEELAESLDHLRDDPSVEYNSLEDRQISDVMDIVNDLLDKRS